tara:strand:+ start:36 stop:935 length:900 start_codon:yes stop_codon:yes gene_type:complete
MDIQKKIEDFLINGFVEFPSLLNEDLCRSLYQEIQSKRPISKSIFHEENEFKKNPQFAKTNPAPDKQNFALNTDLSFIENNETIVSFLNKVLGKKYKIIIKKYVAAVSKKHLPNYVLKIAEKSLAANLNPYIKHKFRDLTFFRGIDYHMDIIDFPKRDPFFLTMYIYLNDADSAMSPLNVIKKSHINGPDIFPHNIKFANKENRFFYKHHKKKDHNYDELEAKVLEGKIGSVYFWTSCTLHGTKPQTTKEEERVSLRYLIESIAVESIIKKMFNKKKLKSTRNDVDDDFNQIKFSKILK